MAGDSLLSRLGTNNSSRGMMAQVGASSSSSSYTAIAAQGFGRLYRSSVGYLRMLVPEFRDKSFVLSTGVINGAGEEFIEDNLMFDMIQNKLYLWSNRSYTINSNGNVGVQRIGVPYKYKKRPSCTNIRKKLLKLVAKRDDSFGADDDRFNYYAALCFKGSVSSSMIEMSASSLPTLFHEFARKLQWTGQSASFVRTQSNQWGYLASMGDLLTVSGGSLVAPEVTHWGPEGFLPMQKQAFGWLSPQSYQQIFPSSTAITYRLRTIREGTLTNSSYPSALVWRDLVYDTDVWFSFYSSAAVFDSTYEETLGDLAHGDGLGFAIHIPADNGLGSVRTHIFGQTYQHSSGLRFETIDYNQDYIDVSVNYKSTRQTSTVPYISVSSKKVQSGTSSRYAKTQVMIELDRTNTNIDETQLDPFAIQHLVTVQCAWGNFTNNASEDSTIMIGPSLLISGSDDSNIQLDRYTTNLETLDTTIIVQFERKGTLTSAEKSTGHTCTIHIGRFLYKDVNIYFI